MINYSCDSIQAGETDWELWISLVFSSKPGLCDDRLHITIGFDDDEDDQDISGVYLERRDQSEGGYGLASKISFSNSEIRIQLTHIGKEQLQFEEDTVVFEFDVSEPELNNMRSVFNEMIDFDKHDILHVV